MIPDIEKAVAVAKSRTSSRQAHRLVDYLLVNRVALTHEIARDCAIGNVSCAASYIRPELKRLGWTIIATLPRPRIRNRYNEHSLVHEWRLARVR